MNLKSLKTIGELRKALPDCQVDVRMQDSNIREIIINGVVIRKSDSYGETIAAFAIEKHRREKRHRIEGSLRGLKVAEYFTSSYDQQARYEELRELIGPGDALEMKEVEVDIDDNDVVLTETAFDAGMPPF
jgi:ribosomal protein L19E